MANYIECLTEVTVNNVELTFTLYCCRCVGHEGNKIRNNNTFTPKHEKISRDSGTRCSILS